MTYLSEILPPGHPDNHLARGKFNITITIFPHQLYLSFLQSCHRCRKCEAGEICLPGEGGEAAVHHLQGGRARLHQVHCLHRGQLRQEVSQSAGCQAEGHSGCFPGRVSVRSVQERSPVSLLVRTSSRDTSLSHLDNGENLLSVLPREEEGWRERGVITTETLILITDQQQR